MQLKLTSRCVLILTLVLAGSYGVSALAEIAKKFTSMLVGVYIATDASYKGKSLPPGFNVQYKELNSKIGPSAIHVRNEVYLFNTALVKVFILEIEDEDDENVRVYHLNIKDEWMNDQNNPLSVRTMAGLTEDDVERKYCNVFSYNASSIAFKLNSRLCEGFEHSNIFGDTVGTLSCGSLVFHQSTSTVDVALRKVASFAELLPAKWTPREKLC